MKKSIVIVDYNCGNLYSVKNALSQFTSSVAISSNKGVIENADAIILPGVGAFGEAMDHLVKLDLIPSVKNCINKGIPFLGICLGMQLLFESSDEFGNQKGLGLLKGAVKRFEFEDKNVHVPHVGWNEVHFSDLISKNKSPLKNIDDSHVYFVHSYYVEATDSSVVLSTTKYNDIQYCSAVKKNNIFATQFHPEKSGATGLKIFENWLNDNNLV